MAKVVSKLDPDTSYVDSCDVNPARFGKAISKLSDNHKIKSYHHVVSAASIIAKVTRDRAIERLQMTHDLGSGYPSDSKTVKFVAKYHRKNKSLPAFVRKSWKPVQAMISKT